MRSPKKPCFFRRLMLFVASFLLILGCPISVSALSESTLDFYNRNRIYYFNPEEGVPDCKSNVAASTDGKNITWIGDSLSGGAGEALMNEMFPGVDYGKTFNGTTIDDYIRSGKSISTDSGSPSALDILENIVNQDKLRPYLVFAIGANYPNWNNQTEENINRFLKLVGDKTQVVILTTKAVNPHPGAGSGYDANNEFLKKFGSEHKNITIGDWAAEVKDEYFINNGTADGGIHYNAAGYRAYFQFIKDTLATIAGSSTSSIGDNKNYAGDTVWSEEQLKIIQENQSAYKKAEAETGVPWEAIATVHSLENGLLKSNPSNGQGIYMLASYTNMGQNDKAFRPAGLVSDAEFERQTIIAAREMKTIIEGAGLNVSSDEGIKALLFQYNGKASQYIEKAKALGFSDREAQIGEGSPYVMNRYDAKRDPNSSQMDPAWPGRFVADGVYDPNSTGYDFGGFVKYIALAGNSGASAACGTSIVGGNMDLNATALALAWPVAERAKSATTAKNEYINAIKSSWKSGYEKSVADANGFYNPGLGEWIPVGKSCDNFVGTVVRFSGIDPDFPVWLGSQTAYLASSDKWEVVEVNDTSQARAGDIRIENGGGHIVITAEENGELRIASASAGERFGDLQAFYLKPGTTYRYRM